jgi:voltage-gated potassium channel
MMDRERRARALASVERYTAVPMVIIALALIPLILVPLVVALPERLAELWQTLSWLVWAAFAAELVVKTYLAPRRLTYLRQHWFDVVIVAVPFLRPLRALQAMRLLQVARLVAAGVKAFTVVRVIATRHGLQYIVAVSLLLLLFATGAVTLFERGAADSPISDFGTALWWTLATATTVGYGDTYPVTAEGKGIGAFVMLLGITLFGLLTANIAAFLVDAQSNRPVEDVSLRDVHEEMTRLREEIAALRRDRPDQQMIVRG